MAAKKKTNRANRKKHETGTPRGSRAAPPTNAWKKGQSGNPSGRPKVVEEIRDLARTHTTTAIERLAELMHSKDGRVAVAACNSILDRAAGRPPQAVYHSGPEGDDIQFGAGDDLLTILQGLAGKKNSKRD